jgi:hypothetical protein
MFGRVQGYDGKPIFMIKVSVYRYLELIDKSYTDVELSSRFRSTWR